MEPQSTRLCAVHTNAPASDICSRCGDFMCLECRRFMVDGRKLCPRCQDAAANSRSVRHVQTLGILLLVHGGLLVLMGLLCVFGVFVVPMVAPQAAMDPSIQSGPLGEGGFEAMMYAIYGGMALFYLTLATLQIVAGLRARKYRSRGLVITGIAAGVPAALSCYCAPTGIALFVYGLYLLTRPEVADAFRRAEQAALVVGD